MGPEGAEAYYLPGRRWGGGDDDDDQVENILKSRVIGGSSVSLLRVSILHRRFNDVDSVTFLPDDQ